MAEMTDEKARAIISKYDEILELCGARPEERIKTTLAKFDSAVEEEVRRSDKVKDMSEEEVQSTVTRMQNKIAHDVMLLVAMSVSGSLQAAGKAFGEMADNRDVLKKSADEYFAKWSK